jgi:hypothetical protein
MKAKFAFALAGVVLVAGCASDAPYREARDGGEPGYTDTLETAARAAVAFQGDADTEPARIHEYALLRAAQVTRDGGYDWFFIVPPQGVQPASAPLPTGPYGDVTPYYDPARRTVSLDIVMGRGQRPPNNPLAFDARELARDLEHLK